MLVTKDGKKYLRRYLLHTSIKKNVVYIMVFTVLKI